MSWFDQNAPDPNDLRSRWNQQQATNQQAGVRNISMDEAEWADMPDFEDNGPKYRWMVDRLVQLGRIANTPEAREGAQRELEQTAGNFLYEPGLARTFADGASGDTYDLNDPAQRAAGATASDLGHVLPDSTDLSQAGWQNVTPDMSQQFRDQGSIPQAPDSERYAQAGNPPPSGGGRLYAGGSADFDESTGTYRSTGTAGGGRGAVSFGEIPADFGERYTTPERPAGLQQPYVAPTWQGGDFVAPTMPGALQTPYQAPTWQGGDFQAPATPGVLQQPFMAPERPGVLQQPYTAPTRPAALQQPFTAPTAADLNTDPGYQARLAAAQKGFERSAAAKGSILSGGSQIALGREQQTLASNEYGNLYTRALATRQQQEGEYGAAVGQSLATRQQQEGEYGNQFGQSLATRGQQFGEHQTNVGNAFEQYKQRYGQFQDSAGMGLQARNQNVGEYQTALGNAQNQFQQRYGMFQDSAARGLQARGVNESAYQNDVGNYANQYQQRFGAHQANIDNRRRSEVDAWGRNLDMSDLSLRAAALARPY